MDLPSPSKNTLRCPDAQCASHSHEVCFPSALQSRRPGPPELTSLGTFHPQDFSPSRRFTSFSILWPCFMPVTLLGFCLQGVFPRTELSASFDPDDPPGVGLCQPKPAQPSPSRFFSPAGIRHSPELLALPEKAAALLIFNSLRSSPGLPWPAIRGPPLLSLFVCSSRSPHTERSTGSYETTRLAGLRKDCHPF